MPWREWDREQVWLMPPSLDEVLADDHPARLVAALVDSLTAEEWAELGVDLAGQALGAPADHPRARLGLVDWALQAVDGTKVAGSASSSRTYDAQQLERLLERTERAIADLEAQNEAGDEPAAPRLPADLAGAKRLRADVLAARAKLAARTRAGPRSGGLLITAADVTQDPTDQAQLLPMIEAAEQSGGPAAGLTLADAGYFSAANLAACAARAPTASPASRPLRSSPGS